MKLIVGLGNPGEKYKKTRHNVGFILVDALAKNLGLNWSYDKSFTAETCKTEDLILAKPQTFMNDSGLSVAKLMAFYKVAISDLIVIHDDVDLPPLEVRFKQGSGTAGHHGIESIKERLGSLDFWRLRVGVGRPNDKRFDVEEYVLQNLTEKEYMDLTNELYLRTIVGLHFSFFLTLIRN